MLLVTRSTIEPLGPLDVECSDLIHIYKGTNKYNGPSGRPNCYLLKSSVGRSQQG